MTDRNTVWQVHIFGTTASEQAILFGLSNEDFQVAPGVGPGASPLLSSSRFRCCQTPEEVRHVAGPLIAEIAGLLWIELNRQVRLAVGHVQRPNASGNGLDISAVFHEDIGVQDGVTMSGGAQAQAPTLAQSLVGALAANPRLAKILRLLSGDDRDWDGLYRLYEEIEAAIGGAGKIVDAGWASKSEIELFKRTANTPAASGDWARHGERGELPPKHPMTLHRANGLIEHLARSWLQSLVQRCP